MGFYSGGWVPECWSATLKVEEDRLFSRRGQFYCEVLPTDIVEVSEFGFNNPFLLVRTADGEFHVGALSKQYDDVVRVLQRYVGNDFCQSFVHRWNVMMYRKQFRLLALIRSLVARGQKETR